MKTTAYLRISTVDQDIEKNKSDILKLANEKRLGYVEFIEEQISGKVSWRNRKIFAIINEAKKDDVIIVSELSRLGRSMLEIMEILSIATQKQLKIYSVKGDWHLDGSIQSKVMAMAYNEGTDSTSNAGSLV
jgi:DNA invertase Pin-like site-specific DNA recombinase